jgi:hypothetical protein
MEQKDYLQPHSYTSENPLPQGINILTILTFIGSALQILGGVFNYFMLAYSVKSMERIESLQRQPRIKEFGGFFKWSYASTLKQYEHRTEILIIAFIAALLCVYGALQMRKLKKQGFVFYTAGELLFPLATFILIDFWSSAFSLFVASIFLTLYSLQRKMLIQ